MQKLKCWMYDTQRAQAMNLENKSSVFKSKAQIQPLFFCVITLHVNAWICIESGWSINLSLCWNTSRRFPAFCLKVMNYGDEKKMCSHLRIKPRIWCVLLRAIHHVHNKGVFAWRSKFMVALLCPNNSKRCVRAWQPLPKTAPLLSIKKHLHMFNFRLISKTFIGYWVIR